MAVERTARYNFLVLLLLPTAGLLSGFITVGLAYPAGRFGGTVLGGVFGAVMAVALSISGVLQGIWKIAVLLVVAAGAYFSSTMVAFVVELGVQTENSTTMGHQPTVSPVSLFAGGVVGGFLILGAFSILVNPELGFRPLAKKVLGWSLVGGVLGIVGWALGPSLGVAIWSVVHDMGLTSPTESLQNALGEPSHQDSLVVVWQTGMAIVLAIMLSPSKAISQNGTRPASALLHPKTRRPASVTATIFLVLPVAILAWSIARQMQSERAGRRMLAAEQAADQRLAAERPSSLNLPAIVELPVDQVLLLKPIAGHPCGRSFAPRTPSSNFIAYIAPYKRSETAGDGEATFADVEVRLYPNSDWAVYATKQGFNSNLEANDPNAVTTVTRFGNKVIMNSVMRYPNGGGDLFFYWASRNRFVQVTFHGPEQDDFLEDYLALYPSSL